MVYGIYYFYLIDEEKGDLALAELDEDITPKINFMMDSWDQMRNTPHRDWLKCGTAALVETYLTGKCLNGLGNIASRVKSEAQWMAKVSPGKIKNLVDKAKLIGEEELLLATPMGNIAAEVNKDRLLINSCKEYGALRPVKPLDPKNLKDLNFKPVSIIPAKLSPLIDLINTNDQYHILHGSRGHEAFHAWEFFFNGKKPKFNQIKGLLNNVLENGIVEKTTNLAKNCIRKRKIIFINEKKVWIDLFIDENNIIKNIANAGVLE